MILIVDDVRANIVALKKILELHGFAVDDAESGEEALRKTLKTQYSLIIMDVQMPDMDGFEVAEILSGANRTKDVPVLFLSAISKEKKYIFKGYQSGGVDYITKPVDPDLLILKVKTFLKLYEQQKELKDTRDMLSKEIEIRRQAQEKLSGQMEELRSVVASLPEIAFIISHKGTIDYVNELWYDFAKTADAYPEFHPDDSNCWEEWEKHFASGEKFSCEIRLRHLATREYRHFTMQVVPIVFNGNITRWVGTFTNIQKQKRDNETLEEKVAQRTRELIEKNEELEFRNHELQQFAWVVSHDLKEPIRKIDMFIKIIKDRFLEKDSQAIDYIDRAVSSSDRMRRLIDDLLAYSRLSSDTIHQKTDLNVVMEEVLADLDHSIQLTHPKIHMGHLPVIKGIPSQLRQVFQNLIGNALKFTREGVTPEIEITSERIATKDPESPADPNGPFCRIVVKDNGIGFDESFLPKIFVIFQSLHDRKAYDGTGIGLAIAKKIIDKHNGLITAKSKSGEGASFIIVLPL